VLSLEAQLTEARTARTVAFISYLKALREAKVSTAYIARQSGINPVKLSDIKRGMVKVWPKYVELLLEFGEFGGAAGPGSP
jgi:hypothetical protein